MARPRNRRLQIDVSPELERKLILWAHCRDSTPTAWARMIMRFRCDENEDKISAILKRRADVMGISQDEYERIVLADNGFDFDAFREDFLNGEARAADD